jgi:hypothetical protein
VAVAQHPGVSREVRMAVGTPDETSEEHRSPVLRVVPEAMPAARARSMHIQGLPREYHDSGMIACHNRKSRRSNRSPSLEPIICSTKQWSRHGDGARVGYIDRMSLRGRPISLPRGPEFLPNRLIGRCHHWPKLPLAKRVFGVVGAGGGWRVAGGEWRVASGGLWVMEDGRWKMEAGGWR